MRPIPGTITDPAMDRITDAFNERFLVMDDMATVYDEFLTREAADAECAGLVAQGVECFVIRVTRLEA